MLASFAQGLGATAGASNNIMSMIGANEQHLILMRRVAALQTQKLNYPANSPQALAIDAELARLHKVEKSLLIQKELANANQMAMYAMRDAADKAKAEYFQRRQREIQNGIIFG